MVTGHQDASRNVSNYYHLEVGMVAMIVDPTAVINNVCTVLKGGKQKCGFRIIRNILLGGGSWEASIFY